MHEFEKYTGIPYEEMDCWDLVRYIMSDMNGIELPMIPWHDSDISYEEISREEAMCGDLVKFSETDIVTHIGIFIDEYNFIHTRPDLGSCIDMIGDYECNIKGISRPL